MHIVICDDKIEDLAIIEKMLLKYSTCHPNINFETEKFSDAHKLFGKIQDNQLADIYILDIIMSKVTGIEIGNQIRKSGNKSIIIYITSSADFALDAYDVHAVRYLVKPVSEEKFFEAVDYALSYIDVKRGSIYIVKTKDGLEQVPYSQIEYIESSSRMLEVNLTNGGKIRSICIRKSFDEEIKELLDDKSFIKVHKSFLINLRYIKKLNRSNVIMESGASIPVSKKSTVNVKREYLLFVSEQYR